MIPITSSTTLSIEKTAKLLQNLIDLRDKGNLAFPEKISKGIDSLVEAQQKFVQGIDDYLHESESFEYEDDIEMVTTIVQTCPEFLATGLENYGKGSAKLKLFEMLALNMVWFGCSDQVVWRQFPWT